MVGSGDGACVVVGARESRAQGEGRQGTDEFVATEEPPVDSGDVTAVRNRTVSIPDQQTFRFDVNASGRIDSGDVTVTRNASVTVLP